MFALLRMNLCLAKNSRATFSINQSFRSKTKTNRDSHAFSRAWRRQHIFVSNSDWFIGLSTSVVIGQSCGFKTLA